MNTNGHESDAKGDTYQKWVLMIEGASLISTRLEPGDVRRSSI